jgi:hypothetical protein
MICKECYANYMGQPGVVLCPLHETTAELLEAAKVALESLRAWNRTSHGFHWGDEDLAEAVERSYEASPEIQGLLKAIQKAEGA